MHVGILPCFEGAVGEGVGLAIGHGAAAGDGDEEGGDGEDGDDDEGGGKKKLLIIGGVVVLLIGAGAGLFFTGMLDGLLGKDAAAEGEEHAGEHGDDHGKKDDGHGKKKGKKKDKHAKKGGDHGDGHGDGYGGGDGAFLEIPTMTVNLYADDGQPRYLRLKVQLELADPSEKGDIEAAMPRVIDQFQTYLRELRVQDLRGSAGLYRLQTELLWRVNQAADPVEVKDVLFQEILIN